MNTTKSGTLELSTLDKSSCQLQCSSLQAAREQGSVNVQELSRILFGDDKNIQSFVRIANLVKEIPAFSRKKRFHHSRKECLLSGLEISKAIVDFHRKYKPSHSEAVLLRYFIDEAVPILLHFEMFIPVLKAQASKEQYEHWGKAAENFEIIGCYAQTELGHGSNLSKLETTATFVKTKGGGHFILNSPSVSSLKWWIGGLGVICTHALVQAKLIVDSNDHGPHLFIVQIRSLTDHSPMPGVEVGDIGAKFGMTKNDNGWVRFKETKICRTQLLSRFAKVDENGEYHPPVHSKISYGGMVLIRAQLVQQAWIHLARAITIATRYTTVRRQFNHHSNDKETQVIRYSLVKYRLFPLISACIVFNFVGSRLSSLFLQMTEELKTFNAGLLPFVHALSSGLKSYCTTFVANAIEECRKICGGHGFSKYSGFFHLYTEYVATNTYEGDNALLTQQLARFLLKCHKTPLNSFEWLNEKHLTLESSHRLARNSFSGQLKDGLLAAFRHRCKHLVTELASAVNSLGFDSQNVLCFRLSVAFCQYFSLESMCLAQQSHLSMPIIDTMKDIYALSIVDNYASDWLEDCSLDSSVLKGYRKHLEVVLFEKLAPEVVRLTDSFLIPDFLLDSALGSYNGDAYMQLLDSALEDPVNTEVNSTNIAYLQYIRPIFQKITSSKL